MPAFALHDAALLRGDEQDAYDQAVEATAGHALVVCPKVRLSQIADVTVGRRNAKAHRLIDEAVIDLLICERPTWKPIAAVVIGGDSRGEELATALDELGLGVIHTERGASVQHLLSAWLS